MLPVMELLTAFWHTVVAVAPYLLLGFLLAGLMSVLMPVAWVRRHLGGGGAGAATKAALFGIPLPICSCGVIPLAAGLRERGASKAATLSFLVATPQTSVDSILLCAVLIGPWFAVFSPTTALLAALVTSALYALFMRGRAPAAAPTPDRTATATADATGSDWPGIGPGLRRALAYGYGKMPDDIGREILIGLGVAALIAVYMPAGAFADHLGNGLLGKLAMVAAAVPVYVCSTSSVPVVAALLAKGVSPGTAFVFFLAGPATNAATVATVAKVLGRQAVAAYLIGVIGVALGAGVLMDLSVASLIDLGEEGAHAHEQAAWWGHAAGVLLLGILLWPSLRKLLRRAGLGAATASADCCGSQTTAATSSCCSGSPAPVSAASCCDPAPAQSPCCGALADAAAVIESRQKSDRAQGSTVHLSQVCCSAAAVPQDKAMESKKGPCCCDSSAETELTNGEHPSVVTGLLKPPEDRHSRVSAPEDPCR
ncbi:MAG: permease [Planctomycetota bacterium]